jgi:hypothetical protein
LRELIFEGSLFPLPARFGLPALVMLLTDPF